MATALATADFISFVPSYADAEDDYIEPGRVDDLYRALFSPEAFAEEAAAAIEEEPTEYVTALVFLACDATATQTYEHVANTIAGFPRRGLRTYQHKEYEARFNAVARVALERDYPALFAQWLTNVDTADTKEIVGAEMQRRLRPTHMVFRVPGTIKPRKREHPPRGHAN